MKQQQRFCKQSIAKLGEKRIIILCFHAQVEFCQVRVNSRNKAGAQLGGDGGGFPYPFSKIGKSALVFKKGPNCVYQYQYLGEKTPNCRAFFGVFLTKCLSKCPSSTKPPPPWKNSGYALAWGNDTKVHVPNKRTSLFLLDLIFEWNEDAMVFRVLFVIIFV